MKPTPRSRPIRSREISRPKKVDSSARRRSDLFGPFGSDSGQGYKQGASIVPPATLAAYKITRADVADLSQGFDPDIWDDTWQERSCARRQIARIETKVPPSWKLADLVMTAGIRGILFPSLRHAGGTNLVIFPANLIDGDQVEVHDPDHRLPQDQSSGP